MFLCVRNIWFFYWLCVLDWRLLDWGEGWVHVTLYKTFLTNNDIKSLTMHINKDTTFSIFVYCLHVSLNEIYFYCKNVEEIL
jgi:hypothetical protein